MHCHENNLLRTQFCYISVSIIVNVVLITVGMIIFTTSRRNRLLKVRAANYSIHSNMDIQRQGIKVHVNILKGMRPEPEYMASCCLTFYMQSSPQIE